MEASLSNSPFPVGQWRSLLLRVHAALWMYVSDSMVSPVQLSLFTFVFTYVRAHVHPEINQTMRTYNVHIAALFPSKFESPTRVYNTILSLYTRVVGGSMRAWLAIWHGWFCSSFARSLGRDHVYRSLLPTCVPLRAGRTWHSHIIAVAPYMHALRACLI